MSETAPAPGWYPDSGTTVRYWDGERWTDAVTSKPEADTTGDGMDALAGLGWLMAFLVPIIGAVIGVVVGLRGRTMGFAIAGTSVVVMLGYWWYLFG